MDKEDELKLIEHAEEIGKILRKNDFKSIKTFEEGELLLRDRIMKMISPEIAKNFFATDELVSEIKNK